MNDWGYVAAAYLGSALLYGIYITWLLRRERRLDGRIRDLEPR